MTCRGNLSQRSQGSEPRRAPAWAPIALTAAFLGVFVTAWPQRATADPGADVDPKLFGFDLPPGAIRRGNGESVATVDAAGTPVIARLHAYVGECAIVLLPDGQLACRKSGNFTTTAQKFEPLSISALADRLAQVEFKGFQVVKSKRHLYLSKSSQEFGLGTSRILDTMVNGVMEYGKGLGIKVHEPMFPLVVVMFGSEKEFRECCKVAPGVTAYYDTVSNRVYLYEPVEVGQKSRELATRLAISTVAHEGAHQILHNIGVQERLSVWPMWLSEGLAEYFAPTAFGKRMTWKGGGASNALRLYELEQYLRGRGETPVDGRIIEATVAAPRLTSAGYASAWGLTHFLASTKKADFAEYMRGLNRLGPLEAAMPIDSPILLEQAHVFRKVFGEDLAEMERRMIAHLKRVPYKDPFADLPHYMAMLTIIDNRMVSDRQAAIFPSKEMAEEWSRRALESVSVELRETVDRQIREFPNRAAAEAYRNEWIKPR